MNIRQYIGTFLLIIQMSSAADVLLEQQISSGSVKVDGMGTGCKCIKYDCGCCLHLDLPKFNINDTGCANITYLPKSYGILVTFSLDGLIIIKEEISARNPPPICFGIPHLEKEASLCLEFRNLDLSHHVFSGCVYLTARLYHVVTEDIRLGCFKIKLPASRIHVTEMKKLLSHVIKDSQKNKSKNENIFL